MSGVDVEKGRKARTELALLHRPMQHLRLLHPHQLYYPVHLRPKPPPSLTLYQTHLGREFVKV